MDNKQIAIHIIQQEMMHAQLISGLKNLGFDTDFYCISMLEVIQPLLGVETPVGKPYPEISDELSDLYNRFLDKACEYPVTVRGEQLIPLAEQCLLEIGKIV